MAFDYHLLVSETENFTNVVLDTVTAELSCTLPGYLKMDSEYYWKVGSNELGVEEQGNFRTRDYIGHFMGTYPVEVRMERWQYPQGVIWVSTYTGTVVIEKISSDKIKMTELVSGLWRPYEFLLYNTVGETGINFLYDDVSRSSFCRLNYIDSTFFGSMITGGLSARTTYGFNGKKE